MSTTNRVKYIDIARGIAILCIILGHFGVWDVSRVVFTFHVPIFFFITGYFANTKLPVKDYIKNKARTLLVPYACTCLVIILLAVLIELIKGGENVGRVALEWIYASVYGAGDSYTEPFYIKQIGALWFLLATFWGSIFLRVALNMKKETRIVFVMALFFAGYWTSQNLFWFPFSIQAGCCATLFMYIGYLVGQSKDIYRKLSSEVKIVLTVFAALVWLDFIINFQSFWLVHCDIGRGVVDIIGCICACYIVLQISRLIEKKSRLLTKGLSYLGKYSLIVLCVHIVELNLFPWWRVTNLFMGFGLSEVIAKCGMAVVKFVFIILATIICSKSKFVKKVFGLVKL